MNKLVNEKAIRETLEVTILKNGQPNLSLNGGPQALVHPALMQVPHW